MRFLAALLASLAIAVLPTAVAIADEPVTWSVEPTASAGGPRDRIVVDTPPGVLISDSVEISNRGTTAATFAVYAVDAVNDLDSGAFGLKPRDEPSTDAGSWITLASSEVTLAPGERATVPFQLAVPTDAAPGDHAAGIVASVTSTSDSGQAVNLEQRVGTRVYVAVDGPLAVTTSIQGLVGGYAPALNPFEPGALEVVYTVANEGNTRVDALHEVRVTGLFGIPLGQIEGEPIRDLLPGQEVRVRTTLPAIAALGLVFADTTVTPVPVGTAPQAGEAAVDDVAAPAASPSPSADAALATLDDPAGTTPEVNYPLATASAPAPAVSWTMLALVLAVTAGLVVIVRSVSGARQSLYEHIDRLEAARAEASEDAR